MVLTGKEYRESLTKRKPLKVYFNGERLADPLNHPVIKASINSVALTFEVAEDLRYKDLALVTKQHCSYVILFQHYLFYLYLFLL